MRRFSREQDWRIYSEEQGKLIGGKCIALALLGPVVYAIRIPTPDPKVFA